MVSTLGTHGAGSLLRPHMRSRVTLAGHERRFGMPSAKIRSRFLATRRRARNHVQEFYLNRAYEAVFGGSAAAKRPARLIVALRPGRVPRIGLTQRDVAPSTAGAAKRHGPSQRNPPPAASVDGEGATDTESDSEL